MICGSGGSKSRLAKAAGAEPAGQMRDEKLHAVVARGHFEVKMLKTPGVRTTFGSWDVEKVHAVVARSTFRSQNVQNTPFSDHFWKLRCRKSARRCGAKHISKWKCTKHYMFAPLLEVQMSKKCTPLWREAHFEVNMYKTHHSRTTFGSWDVEKVHAVVAQSTFRSENVQNTTCSRHFWRFRCRKSARRCGAKHISKAKCTKHTILGPLLEVEMSKKCTLLGVRTTFGGSDVASPLRFTTLHYVTWHHTPLYYITLHYTPQHYNYNYTTRLHSTTLNFTTLHYTTLPSTTLHYIKLHYTTLHYTTLHNTTTTTTQLHSTTLHYTTLHYTTLHYTTLHYTTLHYTTLHYTTLPSTTLHYITLHYTPLHYNYNYDYTKTLHDTKLHYTTLHYTTLHSTTLHYTTLHYTTIHWMTLHHR